MSMGFLVALVYLSCFTINTRRYNYSCVSYNERDMQHIKDEISSQIATENYLDIHRFTTRDVKAVKAS